MSDFVLDSAAPANSTEPEVRDEAEVILEEPVDMEGQDMEENDPEMDESDYEEYDKAMEVWEEDMMMEYQRNKKIGLIASIFFATMASLKSLYFALALFRYTNYDSYWKNGEIGDNTNWWKIAQMILNWAGFTLYSTMALSQILAFFLDIGMINYIIWGCGLTLYGLAGLTYTVFAWVAYEQAHDVREEADESDDDNKGGVSKAKYSAVEISQAISNQREIETHVSLAAIVELATNVIVLAGALPWRRAQVGYSFREEDSDYDESEWEEERYQRKRERAGYKRTDGSDLDSTDGEGAMKEEEEDLEESVEEKIDAASEEADNEEEPVKDEPAAEEEEAEDSNEFDFFN